MLFKEVKNAAEMRQSAVEGKIQAALINPTMLVDPFQVLVAANKAVHLHTIGKMKTRSLYSEIIFNLSPTNKISDAFKRFGVSDEDDAVMVVVVHSEDELKALSDITEIVDGRQVPVDDLSSLSDSAKIKKVSHFSLWSTGFLSSLAPFLKHLISCDQKTFFWFFKNQFSIMFVILCNKCRLARISDKLCHLSDIFNIELEFYFGSLQKKQNR
uniref:Uncharacterized protein n=1 Tax=Gouania willdenowi TaxID=441366 RepID=A0A8C5I4W6_GOUWI